MDEHLVTGTTIRTDGVNGRLYRGLGDGPHRGVLVLHGGGGAGGYERAYAALLAEHGYTALCVEYFDAPGVRDRLLKVPLEAFERAADWLLGHPDVAGDRVGVVGFSRGGEASLLVGAQFDVVDGVVAYVPSCYVWPAPSWMEGVDEGQPTWTLEGEPLPFLPVDEHVHEDDGIDDPFDVDGPNAATLALERATAEEKARAAIPVEEIDGPVLLISGGEDTVWPSSRLAARAAERLAEHERPWRFEHRSFPDAGHAIRVPYCTEADAEPTETHHFGGTRAANAHAAARAWRRALAYLDPYADAEQSARCSKRGRKRT